ncbi:hypothetical protein N7451_012448 [Penicillium sp. IBT 35674x]|nr:hypothetical protein N7451_012448 [Penicillium sp. IBT 35674x]
MLNVSFVNIQAPSDALQAAKEPEVRSHVTRYQWRQSKIRDQRRRRRILPYVSSDKKHPGGIQSASLVRGIFVSERVSISPQITGGLRVDPFQSFPVSVQPWTQLLVDHLLTDPALFTVIILLAASHYASLQGGIGSLRMNLLRLRYEAVLSINRSLAAQWPGITGDALIGAIAKMASYEAMFGSLENYDIHMQEPFVYEGADVSWTQWVAPQNRTLDRSQRRFLAWVDGIFPCGHLQVGWDSVRSEPWPISWKILREETA